MENNKEKINELKKDELKKDELKKDELKKDELKKDELKKDELKKDELKKDELKKDELKKDELKKDELKKDELKKDELKKDEEKKDEDIFDKMGLSMLPQDKAIFSKVRSLTSLVKGTFGLNKQFYNYNFLRFESFDKNIFSEKRKIIISVRSLRAFVPYSKNLRSRSSACLFYIFFLKSYKTYRHLKGLPVRGQRTWSNANTAVRENTVLKFLLGVKAWKIYPNLTKTYSLTAALAEYSNYIWHTNWNDEWAQAAEKIKQMRKSKNLVKIDLYAMSKFFVRVELGDYKVSKKTKQRKKIEKKNSMSTGLPLNFTKFFLSKSARELRHMNLQMYYTKTQNLPKEKEQRLQKGKKGQRAQKNGPKSHKGKKKDKSGKVIKSMKVARKQLKKKKKSVWD